MDEEKDELYSPLEKGGLLKQQGVELSYRRTKPLSGKILTEQFPIEEGRGKKADPQPAGYRKKCEESGKRRVLVCSVEKMFYRRSRWQVSSQE